MKTHELTDTVAIKTLVAPLKLPGYLPKLVSAGFGVILLSWLLVQIDWLQAVDTIRHVPVSFLILAFGCYGGSFCLRALRFKCLLPALRSSNRIFAIVLVHYTALNIVPARLGELSYVYLVNKVYHVSTGLGISSLILARIFDQIAIASLFLVSTLFVEISSPWMKSVTLVVTVSLFAVVVLLILMLVAKAQCASWLKRVLQRLRLDRYRLIRRGISEIDQVVDALDDMPHSRSLWTIFGLSLGIWGSIFTVNFLLFRAFSVPLSYIEIVLASTFMILLTLLPIQMFSGIGIRETAWVFIAGALQVSRDVAITGIIGSRVVSILFLAVFGLAGLLSIQQKLRKEDVQAKRNLPCE